MTVPVLRVMLLLLLLKLISKQFKFPSQISFTADDGWWLWSRLVWPGWRGRDDWMQMVRLGSIAISVRYIWRREQSRDTENIGSSPLLPDLSALLRKKTSNRFL